MSFNVYFGNCRKNISKHADRECLFIGTHAGDNIITNPRHVFIIGDGELGTDGKQDFIIAPVPSITENLEACRAFMSNLAGMLFVLSNFRHLSDQQFELARNALLNISYQCVLFVFKTEMEQFRARESIEGQGESPRPEGQ